MAVELEQIENIEDIREFLIESLSKKSDNNRYIIRYVNFIISLRQNKKKFGYTELHHILPKAKDCFPEFSNLKRNKWNGINLTYRQHFVAHWMLHKILGKGQSIAFFFMCTKDGRINSKTYETLKMLNVEYAREKSTGNKYSTGHKHTIEFRENRSKLMKNNTIAVGNNNALGSKRTQEQKDAISARMKNKQRSEESKRKQSETMRGGKHSQERINKRAEKCKKTIEFTSPDGEIFIVKGFEPFCSDNNLSQRHMSSVANGYRNHHKRWTCRFI